MPTLPNEYSQDPNEYLDYQINWAGPAPGPWLGSGDTIATSRWTADIGITLTDASFTQTTATVWVSGGVAGMNYNIVNDITTAQGRKGERTLRIQIKKL